MMGSVMGIPFGCEMISWCDGGAIVSGYLILVAITSGSSGYCGLVTPNRKVAGLSDLATTPSATRIPSQAKPKARSATPQPTPKPTPKPTLEAVPSLGYVVARLDRVTRRAVEQAVAPKSLTVTQYTILSALARQPGLSSAQLARRAYISPQSMNEMLLALEVRELVIRKADKLHRRILQTHLTATGKRLVRACDVSVSTLEQQMTEGMTAAESDQLRSLMVRAVRNLRGGFPDRSPESN
jgi:DNA-binding MarR family transcriptional regulator